MGFKFNQTKRSDSSQKKKNIRPTNRRCASTIMEQYSERIDLENCRRDLKALLKKCIFKIVAAESVDQEISFLNEVKRLLNKACQGNPNASQYDSLKQIVKEMYQIAADKQIDQYYHQSSKYIDHLNVHDESFRIYALRNFQTLTSNTNGDQQLTFANLIQYNQQSFGLDINSDDAQEDVEDDEGEEQFYEQLQIQSDQTDFQTQNEQTQQSIAEQIISSPHSNISIHQQASNSNITPSQQETSNNRQLMRSSNRTNFNFFSDHSHSTSSNHSNQNVRQNHQVISYSNEPVQIRYQTNNQNQNQTSIVRVNFIDQHIMSGDNDYRISYPRNRIASTNQNTQIRVEDHKDQQQINEISQQNIISRRVIQQNQI
ncbi:hypothetical protein TTHERM_00386990 (macronuclear) [Tetrahymena thermophila SB210]|uniref:Uncharacterized protein n=1 Tax=Tetrahymena thermophila (strain SB210) TaxID=312017 RepID=Q23RJ1_TETTS|nr:hypothetical protein TTHERM_00386990 [Tetrahymena thermophila SB210]EAR99057.1 hypothetical protein TTHERM_00386990 [Tetrahymena thermophila SB210]|eukprot:XP_001019302.1 hypothetical protein TTHERM_00386990 [Tetrahymena thermophila SB210]